MKAYELRTHRLLTAKTLQISDTACPSSVNYVDGHPLFSDYYVEPIASTIQTACRPLIGRL